MGDWGINTWVSIVAAAWTLAAGPVIRWGLRKDREVAELQGKVATLQANRNEDLLAIKQIQQGQTDILIALKELSTEVRLGRGANGK